MACSPSFLQEHDDSVMTCVELYVVVMIYDGCSTSAATAVVIIADVSCYYYFCHDYHRIGKNGAWS